MSVEEVRDDVKRYKAIAAIADQEGGKILITSLRTDIADGVETILSLLRGDEIDIRCAIAKLKSDIALYRVLLRASENAKLSEGELNKLLEIE